MGLWVLAMSVGVVVLSIDLGMANSIRNRLVGTKDDDQRIFYIGFWTAAILAFCYCLLALVFGFLIHNLYHDYFDTYLYLAIAWIFFSLRIPFQISINSFYSYDEATYVNSIEFMIAFSGLIAALILGFFDTNLGMILIVINSLGLGWTIFATLCFVKKRGWSLALRKYPLHIFQNIQAAWPFGFLQLSSLLIGGVAPFLVGLFAGIDEVTGAKASMMAAQAFLSIQLVQVMPLWVEFTRINHDHHGRNSRIDELLKKLRKEVIVLSFAFIVFTSIAPLAINIWLGENVTGYMLTTSFMIWGFFGGIGNIYSMVLNGMNAPNLNGYAAFLGGGIAIISSLFLGKYFGTIGVGVSFALGSVISGVCIYLMAVNKLAKIKNQNDTNH